MVVLLGKKHNCSQTKQNRGMYLPTYGAYIGAYIPRDRELFIR